MGTITIKPDIETINDIENNNNEEKNKIIYEKYNNNNEKDDKNLKNVKNRTTVIYKNIKGIIYKNKEEYGDFKWMIETGDYKNTLFIFDDNLNE